jgi:hypothetical protein
MARISGTGYEAVSTSSLRRNQAQARAARAWKPADLKLAAHVPVRQQPDQAPIPLQAPREPAKFESVINQSDEHPMLPDGGCGPDLRDAK